MNSLNLSFSSAPEILITLASWEERYKLGMEKLVTLPSLKSVIQFHFCGKEEWTKSNRIHVERLAKDASLSFIKCPLLYDKPLENWKIIKNQLPQLCVDQRVVVDISTMPRDVMWNIFDVLSQHECTGEFIYWKPGAYNPDWLSRDPGRPRLALGHGGISEFGKKTLLVIAMGYDVSRVIQLINFFEPQKVCLFSQVEQDLRTVQERANSVRKACGVDIDQEVTDFLRDDLGEAKINKIINTEKEQHNIIMASLGPKPSAVLFYNQARKNVSTALAYTPSHDFNIAYSTGLGAAVIGRLPI